VPFAIVMMRRTIGLSDADVVLTTVAFFAGGFVSLYAWGRAVDRLGPLPVFRGAAWGSAALFAALAAWGGGASVAGMAAFFFALAVLTAGFGVADTHVLFGLAPERDPTPTLVAADVATSLAYGAAPFAAGLALDLAIGRGAEPATAYPVLFALAAAVTALAPLPLRSFRR
jgi:predicted MFS family arabinose efflux permease